MKYSKQEIKKIIDTGAKNDNNFAAYNYLLEAIAKMMYNKQFGDEK